MSNDSSCSQRRSHRRQQPDAIRNHSTSAYRPSTLPATVNRTYPSSNLDDHHYRTPAVTLEEKTKRMQLAETISKNEVLLNFPETQSREIFSAYALFEQSTDHCGSPLVNLPEPGKSINSIRVGQDALIKQPTDGHCGTDDDESDDTDVEDDLFMKLGQELSNSDDVVARQCIAATKQQQHHHHHHHHHPLPVDADTISLPQPVYTFSSDSYFPPTASFLSSTETATVTSTVGATATAAAVASGPKTKPVTATKSQTVGERDPPTINVRIVGGEVIMSPAQEHVLWSSTTATPESSQTRSEEEVLYGTHPFSLRPPPHLSRSRRTSRINPQHQQQQQDDAVTFDDQNPPDGPRSRSPASSKNSNTSAVSPRFMALRKLSESGLVPTPSDLNSPDQQLLHKIEEIFEVQLKSCISEIIWRATESHRDAQRYWEEQKHEILDIGLSILRRLNEQSPPQKPDGKDEEIDTLRKERIDLENEVTTYRLKQIEQTAELEAIKKKNAELTRRLESHDANNDNSTMVEVYTKRIEDLEDQIRTLKAEKDTPSKADEGRPCAVDAELQTDHDDKIASGDSLSITSGASRSRTNWADLMGGLSEWELKYRELEARYAQERPKLEQKIAALETKLKHKSYTPMTTTVSASATATVTSSLDPTQRQDRQQKYKSMTSAPQPALFAPPVPREHPRQQQCYYMNEAGHLTFTTEINGRLSQYTVKLPAKERNNNNINITTTTATATATTRTTSTRLNPHAQPFKAST
ncbi:hypothetical protein BX666DRAFT_2030528 [Dichotomocladium elegans]|nr:hypothetical protein BX666DRAFT_2030528 [Dichotomocladium elegans]